MIRMWSLILAVLCCGAHVNAQTKALDARHIASTYNRGVVKILLYDSLAASSSPDQAYIGRGSGFLVDELGTIFTNRHVIEMCIHGYIQYDYFNEQTKEVDTYLDSYSAEIIEDTNLVKIRRIGYPSPIVQVYYGKGEEEYRLYYAQIVSVSMGSFDGAILKIISDLKGQPPAEKFWPLPIGNSDSTFQGEDLCVYGYPAQYEGGFDLMLKDMSTLTFGKHSGFDYVLNKDFGYIKTDAAINSGNSGGPVFNQDNKVIGIATATATKTNIGLVGGINAMYQVAASDAGLLQQLSARGLKMPLHSAAMKTTGGAKSGTMTSSQIETRNKISEARHTERMTRIKQQQISPADYPPYMRPSVAQAVIGGSGGSMTVKRGDLDLFWQNINENPALKATGNGVPLCWSVYINVLFKDKRAKNFGGFGYEYFRSSSRRIAASNEYNGVIQKIELGYSSINFRFFIGHRIKDRIFLIIDPALMMGSMRGTADIYGNSYTIKNGGPSIGWQASSGFNYMLANRLGASLRIGYTSMSIQELHTDDRDGYSSDYMYFFLNGSEGDPVKVNWSGFQISAGLFFTSANLGKKHKKK